MTAYEFLIKAINHRKDFSLISRPSQVEMACWHWILCELRAGRTVTLGPKFRKAVEYAISRPSQVEMACCHWILGELRAGRTVTLGPEFRKAVEYARALETKDKEGLTELEALMKTGFWIKEK